MDQAIRSNIIVIDDDKFYYNNDSSSNIILKENETNKIKKQTALLRYYSPKDELSNPISNWGAADEKIRKRQEVLKRLKEREQEEARQQAREDQILLEEVINITTIACANTFRRTIEEEKAEKVHTIEARINFMEMETKKVVKVWNARPTNWKQISQHYVDYGLDETLRVYANVFGATTVKGKETALKRWVSDMNKGASPNKVHRNSILGHYFDELLLTEFKKRRAQGFSVHYDDVILLIPIVAARNAIDLTPYITSLDFQHHFQRSWVQRWAVRMDVGKRCGSSKHRLPIDEATLVVKDEKYITTGAYLIAKYDIKWGAAVNIDETFGNYCAEDKTTLEEKGCKKVTIIKGKEKEGVTCTLACAETGHMMRDVQLIFKGKTTRTLNNCVVPQNMLADFSLSGWQDKDTYKRFLQERIIPFKSFVLTKLGLDPEVEWFLLVHDCHWSHLHQDIIDFLKENRIANLYVQAGCTDLRQVLDVTVNRVFKFNMAKEYQLWMVQDFEQSGSDFEHWKPDTSMVNLKRIIHRFVQRGVDACSTPQMEESIKKTFANQAKFEVMRSAEMQARARQMIADEEACGEEILPQRPLEEMQEEDLEQPDDMNGEIEEEEVGQAAEARVREIVSDRNFKRIKFVIRETM